jgi:adenosine deaminase
VTPSLKEGYPLKDLLERGLNVSVNSDDAAYNKAYIGDNFALVVKEYDLALSHIKTLACNSFRQAFISDEAKAAYLAKVEAYFASI